MFIRKISLSLKSCLIVLALTYVVPTQATEDKWKLNVLAWKSTGETNWNHDASFLNSWLGNPTSELAYTDLESNIFEFGVSYQANEKSHFRFRYGVGVIDSGLLIDDDYLSAEGAAALGTTQQGAHRFSRTHSDIKDDDLSYFQLEFGYLAKAAPEKYSIEMRVGYEQWRERYEAYGLTSIECTSSEGPDALCAPVGFSGLYDTNVITNEVTWQSLYFGLDGAFNIAPKVILSGMFVFHPFAEVENEDIHHLRTGDLAQNPSFSMSGDGLGYNLEARLGFSFSRQGSISILYRYWHREVEDGNWAVYGANGEVAFATLNKLETTRKGPAIEFAFTF